MHRIQNQQVFRGDSNNQMKKRKRLWRLWAKALGQKASKNDTESDYIAHIRTVIFITYFVTNVFIVAGVVRHWNDQSKQLSCLSSQI